MTFCFIVYFKVYALLIEKYGFFLFYTEAESLYSHGLSTLIKATF